MKKIFITLLFFTSFNLRSQVTIFSENFGNTGGLFIPVSTYTGYQHYGEQTYTGSASVRNTLPSTGYAGASGVANIFFTNVAGTSITVSGINTYCYLFAFLSVGIWKSTTTSNGSEFVIEYSDNGGPWVQMPFTLPTGAGTAIWRNVTLADYLPITTNLALRFTQTSSAGVQFRIDDINVAGIQNITDTAISNCTGFVYDGTLYTQDSLYVFTEFDYKGCDSLVRIEYTYNSNDPDCVLPIELSKFIAEQSGRTIVISWTTLSEINNEEFILQKSPDAINWKSIYKVRGEKLSIYEKYYYFIDNYPIKGINYYRLINYDGQRLEPSDIIYAIFEEKNSIYYNVEGREIKSLEFEPQGIYFNGTTKVIKK